MTSSVAGCGAITYTIDIIDNTVYTISTTHVVAQPSLKSWVGTHTFTVTGTLDSYTTKTATSNTVTVVISDPCFSTVIDTKAVLDMAASVLGASDTKSFTAFTDSVATASTAFGADLCGVATYRITMSDGTAGVPAYLTLSGKTLTLTPTLTS